ncbi:MAG TPA: N-acetylmuramoyl-L-alanine amidase [Thermomicrobiales bacterium]|nr:N-acetylmuramoyl-L-alanine amidase [Thermomicrobiales bacterium]
MPSPRTRVAVALAIIVGAASLPAFAPIPAEAESPWHAAFQRTWQRADKPIYDLQISRTWLWGPEAFTPGLLEPYAEGPNGQRLVQYFDKSRMEITADPNVTPDSAWYVTNGLLAKELITGQLQTGDNQFETRDPPAVNIAGDPLDPTGPTYATFSGLTGLPPVESGSIIAQRVTRLGVLPPDPLLAGYYVVAARHVQVGDIDHQIASPFWAFMQSEGRVYENGALVTAPLFHNPFYATGYPISEAYWSRVQLDGVYTDVLIQCFERRCLTYTPDNPDGWKVEAGNVGRHYYAWRYGDAQPVPAPVGSSPRVVLDPGHDANSGGALGTEYREVLRTALATRTVLEAAGYAVFLTRPDNDTLLYGDPALMPGNQATMEHGYNQGYAHTTRALQFQPDLYISLHYNGSSSSAAAGMTIYYCDYGGDQNQRLAGFVRDELLSAFRSIGYEPPYARVAEDGEIGKAYGHLATLGNVYSDPFAFEGNRLAGVPAVLVEPLFMTNAAELALLQSDATHHAFALAYLRAIDRYFGR